MECPNHRLLPIPCSPQGQRIHEGQCSGGIPEGQCSLVFINNHNVHSRCCVWWEGPPDKAGKGPGWANLLDTVFPSHYLGSLPKPAPQSQAEAFGWLKGTAYIPSAVSLLSTFATPDSQGGWLLAQVAKTEPLRAPGKTAEPGIKQQASSLQLASKPQADCQLCLHRHSPVILLKAATAPVLTKDQSHLAGLEQGRSPVRVINASRSIKSEVTGFLGCHQCRVVNSLSCYALKGGLPISLC